MKSNNIKCFILLFAIITILITTAVSAADIVIGGVYTTDIRAYINNYEVPAYNVDGNMVVIGSDLRAYGFTVEYNNETRSSNVFFDKTYVSNGGYTSDNNATVGEKVMDVFSTDIKTYVNDREVQSYNINGKMAFRFSELKEYGDYFYNNDTRTATLTLLCAEHENKSFHVVKRDSTKTFFYEYFPTVPGYANLYPDDVMWTYGILAYTNSGNPGCVYYNYLTGTLNQAKLKAQQYAYYLKEKGFILTYEGKNTLIQDEEERLFRYELTDPTSTCKVSIRNDFTWNQSIKRCEYSVVVTIEDNSMTIDDYLSKPSTVSTNSQTSPISTQNTFGVKQCEQVEDYMYDAFNYLAESLETLYTYRTVKSELLFVKAAQQDLMNFSHEVQECIEYCENFDSTNDLIKALNKMIEVTDEAILYNITEKSATKFIQMVVDVTNEIDEINNDVITELTELVQ